jgi:tRNA1(Val) A37 N6-methylase TrmN6
MSHDDNPAICNVNPTFRGWTKPGPKTNLDVDLRVSDDETVDALSGHFRIVQLRHGHRFSTDDLLVAWYGTTWCPSAGRALDLGSGIGSVAMVAAWRLRGVEFVTVEAQERSADLARRSVAYNGLADRFDVRVGDFRADALSADERFDLVLGSPPYWPPEEGLQSDHPQKAACRFELRGDVADYCRTAARHLAGGGLFSLVFPAFPTRQLDRVFDAAHDSGLTVVRWRRVWLQEGDDYHLAVFAMHRTEDLPEDFLDARHEEPPLIVRRTDGSLHPEYRAVKLAFGFPP